MPDENVLGEVDRGFIYMMERLAQERVGAAVSNIAQAMQILDETIEYMKQRKAFGQPVGSFQYNKFLVAELVTKAEVTQAYVDNAIVAHEQRRADVPSTPPRRSGGARRCRTRSWTPASSCTAATGT